jgi:nucleotide-binding universal stress UspA family protein
MDCGFEILDVCFTESERTAQLMTAQTARATRTASQTQPALRTIVVATDFSEHAAKALTWATDLAAAHNAKIILVHAIDTELPALAEEGRLAHHVEHKLARIREAHRLISRTEFAAGRPWSVIASVAKDSNADLIVVGAHGESRFSERVLGTVAQRLLKSTSIPVLVHRDSPAGSGGELHTVLAATDFSEEAAIAISTAVRLVSASVDPVRLVLFHTVPLFINYGDFTAPVTSPQYWDDQERSAARQLETLAASLRSDRLQVEVKAFRGYQADAILREAEAINADLIAIGTVGRTGLNRFLMGSVAEQVLHRANRPVLAVRKPGSDEPIRVSVE